ncbi:MAG TPA: class I SAM-dependent methyltransferase [Candidatus Paceibacterota bacterium]|jgi:2-polyprenyl-3-methyl-5-hydroxy-6-metoxy-1,4-benzoquinol methylase
MNSVTAGESLAPQTPNVRQGLFSSFVSFISSIPSKLYRKYWRIRGVQITHSSEWDRQYDEGVWDNLENEHEKLDMLAQLVKAHTPHGRVLDVACGPGWLTKRLMDHDVVGFDTCTSAIVMAQENDPNPRHQFVTADAWEFLNRAAAKGEKFQCIILCEVLYYFPDYLEFMKKAESLLLPNGVFVVSVFDRNMGIWSNVDEQYAGLRKEERMIQKDQSVWNIGVFCPAAG